MVSVIIPVFNGEKYIEKCIESVINQTYPDWEIIIIDDGSTDNTKVICEDYIWLDNRIKLFYIENSGQGHARNIGLEKATGDYIFFADADDLLKENALEYLIKIAINGNFDIVAGLYYRVEKNEKIVIGKKFTQGCVNKYGIASEIERYHDIKSSSLFGYLWNKIYKREFLCKQNLKFSDSKSVYLEDTVFNLKVFSKRPSYYLCHEPIYYYNVQSETTSRKADFYIAEKSVSLLEEYYNFLNGNNALEENIDLIIPLSARVFCWALVKNIPYEGISYHKIYNNIKKFTNSESFLVLLNTKSGIKHLWSLPSISQKIFYTVCFWLLKNKLYKLLAGIFFVMNPFMRIYTGIILK